MSIDLERLLSQHVQKVLATTVTEPLQKLLGQVTESLALSPLQLAAALMYLDTATITSCRTAAEKLNAPGFHPPQDHGTDSGEILTHPSLPPTANFADSTEADLKKQLAAQLATALQIPKLQPEKYKMVRYRIEIGHNHQVSIEEIKNVFIDESGVDRRQIGNLDIRNNYTLIDLPPGMPPDIFQLLQTVELNQQALQIKRVNSSRKRPWQRRKSGAQNRPAEREAKQTTDMKRPL